MSLTSPSEKYLEGKLRKEIKKRHGIALKFTSPGTDGVPDRLVIMPGNQMYLVEMKCASGEISPIQQAMQGFIKIIGTTTYNVFTETQLNEFLEFIDNDQLL